MRWAAAFEYRITFPDPGVYWYHPHIRQDYGQEMGLYGTIVVEPADPDYWPPVNREITLTLDDILLTDGAVAPFSRTQTTHAAMGRFGDVLLVNGDPNLKLAARAGEVVRFYLVNTANTRVFNVTIPGARMKLVGGDSGRYEHEQFVDAVDAGPLRAGRRRRAVRRTRDGDPGTPHPRPGLPAGRDHRHRRTSHTRPGRGVRSVADQRGHDQPNATGSPRCSPPPRTRRVAFVAEMDLPAPDPDPDAAVIYVVPDAPGGDQHRTRPMPGLRDEAAPDRGTRGRVRLPDAPRGDQPRTRPVPGLRHETVPAHLIESTTGHADHQSHAHRRRRSRRRAVHAHHARTPDRRARASSGRTTWSR